VLAWRLTLALPPNCRPLIDGADDLMAALSCADDLLAGITDLHEVSAEVDEAEERHEPVSHPQPFS